jgi:hypothetical protein
MSTVYLDRRLVVPLLGFAFAGFGVRFDGSLRADVLESVARALLVAPAATKCIVLPDTLHFEMPVKPPIRVCVGPGNEVGRERGGRILWLSMRTRFNTRLSAEHAADSIRDVLNPILGTPRHCQGPITWEWVSPTYNAWIEVEASSDVVRPDNQWRAKVYVEREGKGLPCSQ